jgi:hypothetical protein
MNENKHKTTPLTAYHSVFIGVILISFVFLLSMGMKEGYEKFDANFFQRLFIIRNFNRLKIKLGDQVFPSIVLGQNMWMNFSVQNNMDDYQNASDLTKKEVAEIGSLIAACHKMANEGGFEFLIVVAPNKETIYPERVPAEIVKISERTNIDSINAELRELGVPEMLDLRPALWAEKEKREIYYRTDTHWNGYGAYIGYREIILEIRKDYPVVEPFSEAYFKISALPVTTPKDLAKTIQAAYILEESIAPRQKKKDFDLITILDGETKISLIPNEELPTLLMIHDSFGESLVNFLSSNFRQVNYVHNSEFKTFFNETAIAAYNPDIVLYQIVERNLFLMKNHFARCVNK